MNNSPIGWPDNGFGYDASTQTLNVPRRVLVNAPRSYTGSLLDLRGYNLGSIFSVFAQSNGLPAVALLPSYGNNVATGQVTLSAANFETTLNLSGIGGGGFTLRITNQDTNASVNLATSGNLFLGTASPQPALTGGDGASILAQRNSTNAQTYRVYNTYTSATNYERGKLEWSGNVFNVGTEKGSGGGTARSMALQTDGVTRVTLDATTTKLTLLDPATSQDYRLTAASYWLTLGQGNGTDKAFGFISNTASNVQFQTVSGGFIGWVSSSIDATGTADLILRRDAAGTLAQRNGTNAQTYRVYNTYTSSTNYELGKLEWASNVFRIGTEKGSGGGTARAVEVQTDSITRLALDTTGSVRIVTGLTVATLPAAPTVGMIARVTDASAPTIGSTVAGGGAANALCWYNGTNWTVLGI